MRAIILLAALALTGCEAKETRVRVATENSTQELELKGVPGSYPVREFEYGGCEYIAFGGGQSLTVTHKGNCKYCANRGK